MSIEFELANRRRKRYTDRAAAADVEEVVWLNSGTPLTSTSWDGDSYSTTADTGLDLSAVFGVPAGIRAVYLHVRVRDSASSGSASFLGIAFAPTDTTTYSLACGCNGMPNDGYAMHHLWVPCDTSGDINYAITASGATTCDVIIRVWGYMF